MDATGGGGKISFRDKWNGVFAGGGTDGMVSPLCDNWRLDFTYSWPYDCADPFPPGHAYHQLSQELAMAKYCGWDPTFLCGINFRYTAEAPKKYTRQYYKIGSDNIYEETRIETPYGDLVQESVRNSLTSNSTKPWLAEREDYRKAVWYTRSALAHIDKNAAIAEGKSHMKAVGEKGILGTWVSSGGAFAKNDDMYYHLADWPDEYKEYLAAVEENQIKLLDIYAEAGYDYIFTCMGGTDWLSPWYVEQYELPFFRRVISHWRKSGGKVLWHSCGHVDKFFENGYFNEMAPDILETISEPPVGNVRSLKWAREVTDCGIATKGNMPLNILLEGSEAEVREAVSKIKEQTKGYRHIVGLSDAVLENTPLRKCLAFVDESRRSSSI